MDAPDRASMKMQLNSEEGPAETGERLGIGTFRKQGFRSPDVGNLAKVNGNQSVQG